MSELPALQGTLMRGIGSFYTVRTPDGALYTVRAKKKFRHQKMTPMVGDEVLFLPGAGEEDGWLEEILPRRSECIRPPVANVSLLMLVVAPEPAPDLLLIDRLLLSANRQQMKACLVVTKSDLDPTLFDTLLQQYKESGIPVFQTSSMTGAGLDAVREIMSGETCCLAGQSGVGKSTLLNALFDLHQQTGDISEKIRRGKNTTRKAELFVQGDIRILDTAGFSLLEIDEVMDPAEARLFYPEFQEYEGACRFDPCLHDREPGCSVTAAVARGELNEARVKRYRMLLTEIREKWRGRYD
ncbi:MAG: ribosome small subunit-dependent GTPase A [Clostridiales bacterium]|nr:ribosome small subunit-dependent GTPase A [Clostridiales bacterium]